MTLRVPRSQIPFGNAFHDAPRHTTFIKDTMPDYTHCLRPTFTENIVMTLVKGESVNIYGSKGQGRERLN